MPRTYLGRVLTVAKSPDVSVTDWTVTVLQQSEFPPSNGANGNAHLFAERVRKDTKCVTFAAVCIHADLLQKEEPSDQDIRDFRTPHPSALSNHMLLTREPAEASGYHRSDARTVDKQGVRLIVA